MPSQEMHICGINKFVERDIDMLLAEELRVNPDLGRWILSHFNLANEVYFPAEITNVSVVEDGSEADVVATFKTPGGGRHRLFVENKIDATLMPDQLERYVRRAEGEIRRNLVSSYSIVFFTPSLYAMRSLPAGVVQITFETVAQVLRSLSPSLRSDYRASLLDKAIPLRTPAARDAHVSQTDPYIKEWWDDVYFMLEREFPGFFRHRTLYPRSVYFAPENPGQSAYLRVDFKGHKGEVDLAFKNFPVTALKELIERLGPHPGRIISNGKSSALQISELAPFVISEGKSIIETKVRAAYQAAHDLLIFWKANRASFDILAQSHGQKP